MALATVRLSLAPSLPSAVAPATVQLPQGTHICVPYAKCNAIATVDNDRAVVVGDGHVRPVFDGALCPDDATIATEGNHLKSSFPRTRESRTNNSAKPTEFNGGVTTASKVRFAQSPSLDTGSSPVWSVVGDADATDDDRAAADTAIDGTADNTDTVKKRNFHTGLDAGIQTARTAKQIVALPWTANTAGDPTVTPAAGGGADGTVAQPGVVAGGGVTGTVSDRVFRG